MRIAITAATLALAVLTLAAAAWGQVPAKMNYQVMLTNDSDEPLANESVQLVFRIYDVDAGGASLWTETHNVVTNSIGVVSVVLGTYNPLSLAFEGPLWLQVAVDGEIMLPRRELTSAPYALSVDAGVSGDGHSLDADDGDPIDALYLDEDGDVHVGGGASDGRLELHPSGSPTKHFVVSTGDYGGEAYFNDETGDIHTSIQPDYNGDGGYFWVANGYGVSALDVDGNWNAGDARVIISGSVSSTTFDTSASGDDAVNLPWSSVSSTEMQNEPGVNSTSTITLIDLAGGLEPILSRTIFVPASGFVVAVASAQAYALHDGVNVSSAYFGLSDASDSFPTGASVYHRVPADAGGGSWYPGVSVTWMFETPSAGAYTFYFVGEQVAGDWLVQKSNMSLMYFPTYYGLLAKPLAGPEMNPEGVLPPGGPALTAADIAAEQAASRAANDARIEAELAEMRAEIAEMKATMGNNER